MIEINTPEINIDEINARIEEELQRHKKANHFIEGIAKTEAGKGIDFKPDPLNGKFINGKFIPKDYFLQFHGQEFIKTVYASILHREPDSGGGKIYLEKLLNGELTKVDIIGRLRYSSEGRKKKVFVKGLLFAFMLQTFFKIPVLGWGLRVVTGVLNLPVILKNIQKIENDAIAQNRFMEEKTEKTLSHVFELRDDIENLKNEIIQDRSDRETELAKVSEEFSAIRIELSKQIKDYKITLIDTQRRVQILLGEARKRLPESISKEQLKNMVKEEDHIFDAMYAGFEDRFRGTEKDIKERVKVYLPYVQKALERTKNGALLDVGCGRGEWLELLKENNITATGLDLNRIMVEKCRDADLDVEESDMIAYLRNKKTNTLSVVTGFHIVEHLPFKTMIALFDESFRVLKAGGMIIFETPNPENIMVGACNFYTDPTHNNPIPPHTLAYLIEARGFVNIETLRLHPNDSIHIEDQFLNHYFTIGQDYSVIGFKA